MYHSTWFIMSKSEDYMNYLAGEISKLAQINSETLRYYEKNDLLIPIGKTNDLGNYEYLDKRTDSEKKLRTIETIEVDENEEAPLSTTKKHKPVLTRLRHWLFG